MATSSDLLYQLGEIEDWVLDIQTSITTILKDIKDLDEELENKFNFLEGEKEQLEDDNEELKKKIESAVFYLNENINYQKYSDDLKNILIGE